MNFLKSCRCQVLGWIFFLGVCSTGVQAQDQKIALTFEELPYMQPMGFWRPRELHGMILKALDNEKISAAGFVVQEKVEEDPSSYIVLGDWVSRGHIVGNQTWGDADYNELTYDQFMEHVRDGQKSLLRLSRAEPFNYRFLRFPLLHQGPEKRRKNQMIKTLARADYRIAHVSVKTLDWVFNQPYLDHEGDPEKLQLLNAMYLGHIEDCLEYSEKQSQAVFEKNIPHILQLRAGIATAGFLPSLLQMLKERGYAFVSMTEALDDPAYATEETYIGPLGLTFIDRVAFTRGLPFDEESGVPSIGELRRRVAALSP